MPKQRFVWSTFQNFRERHVALIPFENKHPAGPQDSEAFTESTAQIIAPCFFVEPPIGLRHEAVFSKKQMWRGENHQPGKLILEFHITKTIHNSTNAFFC